jgi:hypothetical protein
MGAVWLKCDRGAGSHCSKTAHKRSARKALDHLYHLSVRGMLGRIRSTLASSVTSNDPVHRAMRAREMPLSRLRRN